MSLESFKEKCRLCLESTGSGSYIIKDVNSLIEATGIKLEESNYPDITSVCSSCVQKLETFQNFKQEIEFNQEYLNNLFQENSLDINEDQKKEPDYPDKKCPICDKSFTEKRKIPLHIKRIHTRIKDYFCDKCDYSAYTKFDIARHNRNIHSNQPHLADKRICPHCAKVIRGNSQLTLHIRKKHLNIKKYLCDFCAFASYGKYEIRSHIVHIHIPKEFKESFPCQKCPSVLSTAIGLKVHVQHKHSGKKPFACFCGKAFSLNETLKTHVRNVHKGERRFACSVCPKRFGQAVRLRDHFNNCHGNKQEIPCLKCNKTFHSSRNLKAHEIYHTEPQHNCESCGKKFFLSNKLKEHMKTHENKSYPCNLCSRNFQLMSSLNRHLKNHKPKSLSA